MRILLTGATGQLGNALQSRLGGVSELVAPNHSDMDLGNLRRIASVVNDLRPNVIINAAAYTAVDDAETHVEVARAINTEAPKQLANAAAACGAAIIHYSTDYVFNGSKPTPYDENDAPQPINVYGETKLAGEAGVAGAGAPHLILRVCWLYSRIRSNFLLTMLRLGQEKESLAVVNDQRGAPSSAAAIADATITILRLGGADIGGYLGRHGGTANLACRGHATWFEFAEAIFAEARAIGLPLKVRELRPVATDEFPRLARRPRNSCLDLRRIADLYGLHPPHWRDALQAEMAGLSSSIAQTGALPTLSKTEQ